jgi:hypothetical protein
MEPASSNPTIIPQPSGENNRVCRMNCAVYYGIIHIFEGAIINSNIWVSKYIAGGIYSESRLTKEQ